LSDRRRQGYHYETLAAEHLEKKGYRILERNLHVGRYEVDLIARDEETLVFVEVKGRRTSTFGRPLEAVDRKKRARLARAAAFYLTSRYDTNKPCRFDVVSVIISDRGKVRVDHVENAFEAR
jgi:putative endonuclease